MKTLIGILATFLLLASVPLSQSVAAQWHVISGDGKEVSSTCLGSNENPTCLAESSIACSVWSETVNDSLDGKEYRPPVCDTPGLLRYHDKIYVNYPKHLARYLYRLETWILTEADIPAERRREDWLPVWRAGDTVVDVVTIRCIPNRQCLEKTGTPKEAGYGEGCPIVRCSGPPDRPITYFGIEYDIPDVALIMRRGNTGWHVIYEYSAGSEGNSIENRWHPERWRHRSD